MIHGDAYQRMPRVAGARELPACVGGDGIALAAGLRSLQLTRAQFPVTRDQVQIRSEPRLWQIAQQTVDEPGLTARRGGEALPFVRDVPGWRRRSGDAAPA